MRFTHSGLLILRVATIALLPSWTKAGQDISRQLKEADLVSSECSNPLFKGHWYSTRYDAAHFESRPSTYESLGVCRMWNGRSSCCNPSMEGPQKLAFASRKTELQQKRVLLESYLGQLMELARSEVYTQSEPIEQALFDRALDSFRPVIEHSNHCFEAVMVFVAGMICFGCHPHWNEFVWRDASGAVTAVNIGGASCIYVAHHCSPFGHAVTNMMKLVMESALAKHPLSALPDFSMLADREQTCQWLRTTIAMQPLRSAIPAMQKLPDANFRARLLAPSNPQDYRRALSVTRAPPISYNVSAATASPPLPPVPTLPPYATKPIAALDPVGDGQQSGFEIDMASLRSLRELTTDVDGGTLVI